MVRVNCQNSDGGGSWVGQKNLLRTLLRSVLLHDHLGLGASLRGRTATQRSKKGSEKVLGRVLGKGFSEGF